MVSVQKILGKEINAGELALKIDILRNKVVLLQNYAVKFGSSNIEHKLSNTNIIVEMLSIIHQIDIFSAFEDTIFYLDELAGIAIIDTQPIPINAKGEPITNFGFIKDGLFDLVKDEFNDIHADKPEEVLEEFYSFSNLLDEPVLHELNFTISNLYNSYMAFANFAQKYGGVIVLTPLEFDNLLSKILQTDDVGRIQAVANQLQCSSANALSAPYQIASFYSPIYVIPVGEYEMVVLSDNIIDFARSNFFHDFTYGSNSIFSRNKTLQGEYNRLKQKHITAPFEEKTADLFTRHGWKVLLNTKGGILHGKKVVAVVPDAIGEIDIIALSPDKKTLVVADCKYLFDYGATAKEIKSLKQKFTGNKSYFSQVERKQEWVAAHSLEISKALGNESEKLSIGTKAMIVTRNRIPLKIDTSTTFLAFYDLEKWLGKFI